MRACRRAAPRAVRAAGSGRPARGVPAVSLADRGVEQAEQHADLLGGARPVLAAEREEGQRRDAAPHRVPDDRPDGLDAGRMALGLAQAGLAGPPAVAVHDDRDVARQVGRRRSPSSGRRRAAVDRARRSTRWPRLPVGRSMRELTRPPGSPVPSPPRGDRPRRHAGRWSSAGLELAMRLVGADAAVALLLLELVGGLAAEIADLDPGLLHPLVDDPHDVLATLLGQRRDVSRTTVPSTFGMRPMSLLVMAFSIAPRTPRSQGWMTIWCGSGTLMPASWLSGVDVP